MIGRQRLMLRPARVVDEIVIGGRLDRQIRRHGEAFIVQLVDGVVAIVRCFQLNMAAVPLYLGRRLTVGDCARQHQVLVFFNIYFVILFSNDCAIR